MERLLPGVAVPFEAEFYVGVKV